MPGARRMSDPREIDRLLVEQIRNGNSPAWTTLIRRYEGRLLAFCESRLRNRAASEDIVQETFVGFLTSLPNYDCRRALESYLFSICAHKLTDYLRREGRRPKIPLETQSDGEYEAIQVSTGLRGPSTIVRSQERRDIEEEAITAALTQQIDRCRSRKDWTKLKCLELLIVRGKPNKEIADRLALTQQQVANFKSDFIIQLRKAVKKLKLPPDIFPELAES